VLVLFLWAAYRLELIREPTIPDWNYFFMFYVFVSSPLQEFLFRSLVFRELESAGAGKIAKVAISTVNFGLMHIFYHDWVTFLSALFIGLCLGLIYSQTRSIYGISASHAVVGALSIYVGLV
ncbi:MAG: CPBP family intramembrane metalloprotease, partial [Bacteroidales bacterium]|nr:CPBP family intramembrane metalloprotease [Bacteroidales bacterium]